jgi:AraC-like DNA-binding protein
MTQDRMASLRIDTTGMPAEAGFALWADAMVGYEVSRPDPTAEFTALVDAWMLGPLVLTHNRLGPLRIARTRAQIRGDHFDHYSMVLPLEGWSISRTEGRELRAVPGVICVFDNSRPQASVSGRMESIILLVPRETVERAAGGGDLHGVRLDDPAGRLLADHLTLLVRHLPNLAQADAPHVAEAITSMLTTCLGRAIRPSQRVAPATGMRRAVRLIDGELASALTPEMLQARLNLSRASLYRMFRPLGGVAHFIRARRLTRIHALVSAGDPRSVTRLAADFGFASATQLTRGFRARFGYSLSDLRQRTQARQPPLPGGTVTGDFRQWLDTFAAAALPEP